MSEDERTMRQLAEDTAAEINGWQVERKDRDYGHYVQIEGPGGAAIGFRLNYHKKTVSLSGVFPADRHGKAYQLPYNVENPRINVGLGKTGKQVATDIARRLWPGYEPLLEAALKSHERYASHENTSLTIAKRLAKIVDAPVEAQRNPTDVEVSLYHSRLLPEFNGKLVVSGDSIRLDRFYVDADQAEAILRALVKGRLHYDTK